MSEVVPHKRTFYRQGRLRQFHAYPETISFTAGQGTDISFSDGSTGRGTCLGCHDAPCMELTETQLDLGGTLGAFPGDPSRDVCPTNAIEWNEAGELPTIDTESCIGCGLCITRCPYGAINLSSAGKAVVEGADPDGITSPIDPGAATPHVITARKGALGSATAPFARDLPEIVDRLTDTQTARLARNMLAACGIAVSMRRKGDTNIRIDGLLRLASGQVGVVELETSAAVLESPRALLEDIAVLHSRFGVPLADIVPTSVLGVLPNERVEYYQVIDDIAQVLNIRCHTLTLGALCMLMWHFATIDSLEGDLFATQARSTDLHPSLIQLIPGLPAVEPYPGAYRPPK